MLPRLAGLLIAFNCAAQLPVPSHSVEIKVPAEVASERLFIRYALTGQRFGGWVEPSAGLSSYFIDTNTRNRAATRIRAILYAPGCAIQTLDLALDGSNAQYAFVCHELKTISIGGTVSRADRFMRRPVKLEARYLARWAQRFLGLDDDLITAIPVGDIAELSADGRFRLVLPDLSQDPLAGAPDHAGEVRIYAKDKKSEALVAQLIPTGLPLITTRMGGLNAQSAYPADPLFTTVFEPCATTPPPVRTREGFLIRPEATNACR
jgi:hypothetical protein